MSEFVNGMLGNSVRSREVRIEVKNIPKKKYDNFTNQ